MREEESKSRRSKTAGFALTYDRRSKTCRTYRRMLHPAEEPELIRQMKEAGMNPLAQASYLILMPEQQTLGAPRTIDMRIGNLETGITYLQKHYRRAHLLRERLNELMEKHPSHFASTNGGSEHGRKPDSYSARRSMSS